MNEENILLEDLKSKKGVIYARYSTGSHQTDQSIEGQLRDCYNYARSHNITIIEEYIDRHISGKDAEKRPAFQKMIADSNGRKFSVVLVWKLDRFARNRYDSARYKAALKKNGAVVQPVAESVPEGAEGIILESMLEGMAEYFSADLSKKVKRGMLESAHKGLAVTHPPLGYKIGPDKKYIIDETKAPFIRQIFEMYVAGKSQGEIARKMNSLGVRTVRGNKFTVQAIHHIIEKEKYTGTYESQGVRIEGGMPAIISKETWLKAQQRKNAHKKGTFSYKNNGLCAKQCYLLSGKIFCVECGSPMVGDTSVQHTANGERKQRTYYSCNRRKTTKIPKEERCHKKAIRKEKIEELVKQQTRLYLMTPEVLQVVCEICQREERNDVLTKTELRALQVQRREIESRRKNLLDAIEQGIFTLSTKERLLDLEQQKFDIEEAIKRCSTPKEISQRMKWLLTEYQPSEEESDEYWKEIMEVFINSVHCFNDGRVIIVFNLFDDDPLPNRKRRFELNIGDAARDDVKRTTYGKRCNRNRLRLYFCF